MYFFLIFSGHFQKGTFHTHATTGRCSCLLWLWSGSRNRQHQFILNNNALPTAKQHHYYPCIVVYTLLHTRMNKKVSGQEKSMDLPGVFFELIQPSWENIIVREFPINRRLDSFISQINYKRSFSLEQGFLYRFLV